MVVSFQPNSFMSRGAAIERFQRSI